jgi:hypothetical protein
MIFEKWTQRLLPERLVRTTKLFFVVGGLMVGVGVEMLVYERPNRVFWVSLGSG